MLTCSTNGQVGMHGGRSHLHRRTGNAPHSQRARPFPAATPPYIGACIVPAYAVLAGGACRKTIAKQPPSG